MRTLLLIVGVLVVAVLAIGINRIVVTDGHIDGQAVAFKSDYFPLERQARLSYGPLPPHARATRVRG